MYFFGSRRPLRGKTEISEEGSIWVSERVGNEWGEPQFFRSGLMFVSVTKSDDLYSTNISLDEGEDGYSFTVKLPLVDGEYLEPVSVYGPEGQVNKKTHPCIAPDESYMIFDEVRREGFGEADLYISYRKPDGN
ncbi:MAG: hypothetical protein OEY18_16850 [Candidatus Aminicenantes bacterium]|nr:hypothetical protein [Candidatus Aminicenantes bacterium]